MYSVGILLLSLALVSCQIPFGGRRPFGGNRPGGGRPRPFGGQGRPFGGQGRPFGRQGGQGRPFDGQGGQGSSFNERPFGGQGGQGRPFGGQGGQGSPFSERPFGGAFGGQGEGWPIGDRMGRFSSNQGADSPNGLDPHGLFGPLGLFGLGPLGPGPLGPRPFEPRRLAKCPMIPGLARLLNPMEFIGGCFNLTTRCEAPCGEGEDCCPTRGSEGVCQWECKATVDPKPKAGQCPAAPAPEVPGGETDGRWIRMFRMFCRFAVMNGKADPIQCRHDGDCAGSQKCCSPKPNPDNFLDMCKRQCIDV